MEKGNIISKLLIIGGSAGSLDVLIKVLPKLDIQLNIPILLVLHRKNSSDSLLTNLLADKTPLVVKEVEEKESLKGGVIYIAPADYHVLIESNHTLSVDYSEKVNFSRPSIDVTFQTAAEVYRENLVCILLSGSSADGVSGLKQVKKFSGIVCIQDPETANFSYMPSQAKTHVDVDKVLMIEEMHTFINALKTN